MEKRPVKSESFICFSGYLQHAMFQFARAAQDSERKADPRLEPETGSYVIGAITTSAAFLESLVNEVFLLAKNEPASIYQLDARQAMTNLWGDAASKLGILAKYDLVLALNNHEVFDQGHQPYQDAETLIALRNAVLHYQVGFRSHPDPEPLKIEKRLKGKFRPSVYYKGSGGAFFPARCLGAGCAVWAVKAARTYADEFHRRLGAVGHYQAMVNIPTLLPE